MADYKSTLNLPATDFPMRANLAKREPARFARWNEQKIYQQLMQLTKDRPKFILHDGPPYANGKIHLGHAVNKILKDIILKSKTLSGFSTPYIPGWDCHGLPIELNVEKKLGKAGHKVSVREFRQACRKYAAEQVKLQSDAFQRLGVFGDWEKPYLTMDYEFEANIMLTLRDIIANGYLQRGYKPVHWCVDCGSALAEAELEYKDKQSSAIDVRFSVVDEEAFWSKCQHTSSEHMNGSLSVIIWTTTPWTLPANEAVTLHAEFDYVIVECKSSKQVEYLFIAEALVADVMVRCGISDYQIKATCQGADVSGLLLQHPFLDKHVPIVLADHVTLEAGTGAVHTAPGHGLEDYLVGLEYNLPVDHAVESNGCFAIETSFVGGKHVTKANDLLIDVLQQKDNLLHVEMITHSYPHCWRHKTPVIFRGTPQWFISMDQNGLRQKALKALEDVKWIPKWGEARMHAMLEGRPDWCISRQRSWGVPIPVFIHNKTGQLHPDTLALIEPVMALVKKHGIEAWFDLKEEQLLGDDAAFYTKSTDVLDVWFDSGASYACVLQQRPELAYPADVYIEGSDQYRGWFQSSLLSATAKTGQAPYKRIITHGFTVDEAGRKMSKSLGNTVHPEEVMNTLGADILRLWTANTDYRAEMSLSDEILKRTTDIYRRIRNTARYLLATLNDFDPKQHLLPQEQWLALDQWAVATAAKVQNEVIQAYDDYQFHLAIQKIHHFCSISMGSFYLDIIKDRQYTMKSDSVAYRSAQSAIYHIVEALSRWLAPVLAFTAEEISEFIPGERPESIFFSQWYDKLSTTITGNMDLNYWNRVIQCRDNVNKELEKKRNDGEIKSALGAEVTITGDRKLCDDLNQFGEELKFVFITSKVTVCCDENLTSGDMIIAIKPSSHTKCVRCWHHCSDVGSHSEHPELCGRCVTNAFGEGEKRQFV